MTERRRSLGDSVNRFRKDTVPSPYSAPDRPSFDGLFPQFTAGLIDILHQVYSTNPENIELRQFIYISCKKLGLEIRGPTLASPEMDNMDREISDLAMKTNGILEERRNEWSSWIGRNQDVLRASTNFRYRMGSDMFEIRSRKKANKSNKSREMIFHVKMKTHNHDDLRRDGDGHPQPILNWTNDITTLWEINWKKIFSSLGTFLNNRFRRLNEWGSPEDVTVADIIGFDYKDD